MRLIARLPDNKQVGFLVDSLRNEGFDRKDMIITDLAETDKKRRHKPEEVAGEVTFMQTENDGLWETVPFRDGIEGFKPGKRGLLVAVETPRHEINRVRAIMEQSGAVEILQD